MLGWLIDSSGCWVGLLIVLGDSGRFWVLGWLIDSSGRVWVMGWLNDSSGRF